MGSGTECPKRCTIEGAGCATVCGAPLTSGTCVLDGSVLFCDPIDDPIDPSDNPIDPFDDELSAPPSGSASLQLRF
ncbi:MAG: hypothetical protein JRF48_03655 [Deltaproteobacteria bacterium]|nr:hypothetical protein [Deltaproteobacteria bacterium]